MANVKLNTLILALSFISVSSLSMNSKAIERRNLNSTTIDWNGQQITVMCPANCVQPMSNPCQANPCLHGGQCIPTGDQGGYQCTNCPYPMGGKNCAETTCGSNCFKVDDRVYFIYPNTNMSWGTSYSKCQEEGMTMAIFKEPSVLDPVRQKLAGLNVDHYEDYYCYWIGLNRTSTAATWKWVDETELGNFQPWFERPVIWEDCADICNDKWSYNFTSDFCSGSFIWQYFSLCEKTLP